MRKIFILLVFSSPFFAQAQLKGLMNKAKNKIDQRIDNKIDREMEKTLDKAEGKETATASSPSASSSPDARPAREKVQGYSKFDFVPGARILYAEDFAQDNVGELPLTWNSSGKGEVMTLNNRAGKWMRAYGNNTYLTGNKNKFGENFTIEFDLMYFFEPDKTGYVLPGWSVGLFSSGDADAAGNNYLKDSRDELNSTNIRFGYGSYALAQVESKQNKGQSFISDKMELGEPTANFNQVVHYSIQVQKTRLRVWINERKVFDIPRAINASTDTLNQIFFKMEGSNYKEHEIGLFLSNIKIATGLPDTRHKLIEEGKFSTTGILFDVNQATIRPESNGVLKEIAEVLKSSSGIRVKIIGHTDSDGADAANLELSKKRSEAVKAALVDTYGVDAASIDTDGKGESQPVGDNKTKEGKAQNRRVEFIKQ